MEKLASYLERTGKTQGEFAKMIGVDQSVVSRYLNEKDPVRPTYERAALIEKVTKGAVPITAWVQQ